LTNLADDIADALNISPPVGGIPKRLFDLTCAIAMLIVFAPLMLIILVSIRATERGPVLFRHQRIGFNGRPFYCLKFRSMAIDAQARLDGLLRDSPEAREEWANTRKLRNDPRITPIGQFLRTTSLDELPQIINVLRGDMSVVGPRPVMADELAHYVPNDIEYRMARPGITGLWQVSGRSDTTYAERVNLDVRYVREWSAGLDLQILLKTVAVVMRQQGSR